MATSTEPRVPIAGRVALDPEAARSLFPRQVAWALAAGTVTLLAGWSATALAHPDLVLAVSLGAGLLAAFPRQLLRGLAAAALVTAGALVAGLLAPTPTTLGAWLAGGDWSRVGIAGAQLLGAGAAAGLGMCWLDRKGLGFWRTGHTVLATAAAAGLGWWVASRLVPAGWQPLASATLKAAITGLLVGQGLLVAGLRYSSSARIPSPARIKATLREPYRSSCLKSWQLDQDLARQAPDPETRDGLGEVAAWIYKLHWTLQKMDGELGSIDQLELTGRIAALYEAAESSDDEFTRDRKMATAKHLEQLLTHARALDTESKRTQALVDYATAFLEEARASLVLAGVQPGDQTPARLDDVLHRLRTYSQEREVHRRTRHEVGGLAG